MKPTLKIITTEDGSHSLINTELNETYHSFHGARGESEHVFVQAGLNDYLQAVKPESIIVFEVGFGTGLNAWLTYEFARQNPKLEIEFITVETVPVPEEHYRKLNYSESAVFQQLHECSWGETHVFENFSFQKIETRLEDVEVDSGTVDIVFFDAFAPSKQAEIWSTQNLQKCSAMQKKGGYLVTYCAQGQFKRNLAVCGYEVQTLPGAMGKKEMVRGVKA